MSDTVKIQTTAPEAGAQQPLERTGNEHNTVFRSFPPAPEVLGSNPHPVAPNTEDGAGSTYGLSATSCGSPVSVAVKPVDRRTITGSTPGDFRAQAAPANLPKQPAPRSDVGQTSK